MRCEKQRETIRREKVGGREGVEGGGGERRYRYGGFYNRRATVCIYTFLLRFYTKSTGNSRLIVETVGTL